MPPPSQTRASTSPLPIRGFGIRDELVAPDTRPRRSHTSGTGNRGSWAAVRFGAERIVGPGQDPLRSGVGSATRSAGTGVPAVLASLAYCRTAFLSYASTVRLLGPTLKAEEWAGTRRTSKLDRAV